MAMLTTPAPPRRRRSIWQVPLNLAADALRLLGEGGVRNAAKAIDDEDDSQRTFDARLERVATRARD